jgi:hypothetical protein
MRTHFSSAVAIVVTLLFVLGTVGCRSNGGPWYNPKSYSWSQPFAKDSQAPPYSPDALANKKPSLEASPNVSVPQGGYTDESSLHSNRSIPQGGTPGGYPLDQGGYHSPVASNTYGGYSVAEPSPYPPTYAGGQPSAANAAAYQYQYPSEVPQMAQQGNQNQMPYGYSDYAAGTPAGTQYHPTSAVSYTQATPNYPSVDNGTPNPAMTGGNYAPFSAALPQNDPYVAAMQQPAPVTPTGGYYDQSAPAPYTNGGVPVATPYQPYQPTGGYSY